MYFSKISYLFESLKENVCIIPCEPHLPLFPFDLSSFPSGTTLTSLQLSLKFAGLAYIPAFTKIYQGTLGWFPGFVFTLSSIITVLGMIPIRYGVNNIMVVMTTNLF